MNSSTFVLVGALVATAAIVYQGTMAGASQRPTEPGTAATSTELAHSQTRGTTPAPHTTPTPAVVAAKTPALKLTLDQVRQLPRPVGPTPSAGHMPPAYPATTSTPAPAASPAPPSEVPAIPAGPAATAAPATPAPTATPNPWDIPTPPPLPPPPDNWVVPYPPTE
ncbi:MAG: hypothetical protein AMXMBFR80_01990 [Dehalococcoidia bacterium]